MHDPLTVAFTIRSPWPQRQHFRSSNRGPRWNLHGAFWKVAGREYYWPPLITVWHREPGGHDSGTVCTYWRTSRAGERKLRSNAWRWHVWHWRIQVHPLQHLRRWLLTRCEWCHGPSRKGDLVNVSHEWDRERGHWWRGERGLFHSDCSGAESAHRSCTCDESAPRNGTYGECLRCGRFYPYGRTPALLESDRTYQRLAKGERPTPEMLDYIHEIWRQERAEAVD